MPTTINFEGLPGSGKTTASERFCKILCSNGIDANWWCEEALNHPIMTKEKRALSREQEYPQICLDAWLEFLISSNRTVVFDGYALQSTVRFLYANRIARTKIEDYYNRWQELAPDTTLVYFFVENPIEHYKVVFAERGDNWTRKLCNYVERSPVGIASGYNGRKGFLEFWSNYQQLCYELLDATSVPVHFIESRSWKDDDLKVLAAQLNFFPKDYSRHFVV